MEQSGEDMREFTCSANIVIVFNKYNYNRHTHVLTDTHICTDIHML